MLLPDLAQKRCKNLDLVTVFWAFFTLIPQTLLPDLGVGEAEFNF